MTPTDKKDHVEPLPVAPVSPSGGPVVACELDKACVQVDCEQLAEDVADVLDESPDAPDYLLHYCGVGYMKQESEKDRKK